MANLTSQWLKAALEVTGSFETDGNPWAGVSNDFDGMGISCGILQWNIGSGSLQPIVKACGQVAVQKHMPGHGNELWMACNSNIANGLAIVREWQPNKKLRQDVLNELRTLFGSPEMVEQQMTMSTAVGEIAMKLASRWGDELRGGDPHLKEFCLFFDLVTQSGGMKNVWLDDVLEFIEEHPKADTAICEWILNRPANVEHLGDGRKNAALWRDNVAQEDLELFTLAYLRCLKSRMIYQVVALNRRGTIAQTRGWVNGSLIDLPQLRNSSPASNGGNVTSGVLQKFLVNNESLNLRSAPDPADRTNIMATLPLNHEVVKLQDSNVPNWWKVQTTIDGITKEGYVNRTFLSPA